ncbi:tail fiber protein [Candidatus Pacearchaeota archaeon]|nr:tail fiber protein [Candidatus Pacearchaeota archaeon]
MTLFSGQIILWFGSIASIPAGWVICDGNNGTPDLRDQFVVGAGGAFAVDDSGGAFSHLHAFVSDLHSHDIPAGTGANIGVTIADTTSSEVASGDTELAEHSPPFHALAYIMKT